MLYLGLLLLNRRSEFIVVTCWKANEKLNVAAERTGHLHRAQINILLAGPLMTFHNAWPMEVVRSYHLAVSS